MNQIAAYQFHQINQHYDRHDTYDLRQGNAVRLKKC